MPALSRGAAGLGAGPTGRDAPPHGCGQDGGGYYRAVSDVGHGAVAAALHLAAFAVVVVIVVGIVAAVAFVNAIAVSFSPIVPAPAFTNTTTTATNTAVVAFVVVALAAAAGGGLLTAARREERLLALAATG